MPTLCPYNAHVNLDLGQYLVSSGCKSYQGVIARQYTFIKDSKELLIELESKAVKITITHTDANAKVTKTSNYFKSNSKAYQEIVNVLEALDLGKVLQEDPKALTGLLHSVRW